MKETLIYVDRKNTDCVKWDAMDKQFDDGELLALWIADMDFQCPKSVREAVRDWAEHGVYGYYSVPRAYYDAFIRWERERHGYEVERPWIRYAPGIVSAVHWLIQLLSRPGDAIAMLTPVYYPFFAAVEKNGRKLVCCDLINQNGVYTIDFDRFEKTLAESKAAVFVLCSPHNPIGRIWERWELERLCDICDRHGVAIISDEIHQDLEMTERRHIPTATVCKNPVATLVSASKTFNVAGLQNSYVILPDAELRARYDTLTESLHLTSGSMVGYIAARAAFEGGAPWLEALLDQVRGNYAILKAAVDRIPGAVLSPMEGTYLGWLDLSGCIPEGKTKEVVQGRCRLAIDFGDWFGGEDYSRFIRINLATRAENIRQACDCLVRELGRP